MLPKYDFSQAVKHRHATANPHEYTTTIYRTDDGITIQHFAIEENSVWLAPDVRQYFPTGKAVNRTLRELIAIATRPIVKA
ncbi:MAG: hypothetical protein KIH69_008480 [Anaerolineae bacterium]|nr:hypothetical protein [Anaerolineae bacterium]